MSIFAWNWLWRIVFVCCFSAFIAVRSIYPDFYPAVVVYGSALIAVGIAAFLRKMGQTRLRCPDCGINSNAKHGEDGYRPSMAIFPLRSCSGCGRDFTAAQA